MLPKTASRRANFVKVEIMACVKLLFVLFLGRTCGRTVTPVGFNVTCNALQEAAICTAICIEMSARTKSANGAVFRFIKDTPRVSKMMNKNEVIK